MGERPLVLGHRGAPFEAPENTIASFEVARAAGADGVELDVQLSADGVPVVIHDDTLERTTDGRGLVSDVPWSWIRTLRSRGEPVSCLADAARWAADTGVWLNVEIKARTAASATVAALREAGLGARVIVSSFHPSVVSEVGALDRRIRRFLLSERWDAAARQAATACGAQGICLGLEGATARALQALREADLPVVAWTVDDPRAMRRLIDAGVLAIITNRPDVAARVFG